MDDSRSGIAVEESKSQVEQGEVRVHKRAANVRKAQLRKSKSERGTISSINAGFIDLESGNYEEIDDMEAVAGGIRRELSNAVDPPSSPGSHGQNSVPLLDEVVKDMRKSPSPKLGHLQRRAEAIPKKEEGVFLLALEIAVYRAFWGMFSSVCDS